MTLDIVMYHYVRPILNSRQPKIKGLELEGFVRQLEFFEKNKNIATTSEVIEAVQSQKDLPSNSVWLTFDDGYKDHYDYVAPILERKGIDAAFFPISDTYESGHMLDVNKIHYILGSIDTDESLITLLKSEMKSEGYDQNEIDSLWVSMNKVSRYDSEEVTFFKRLLQRDLDFGLRKRITDRIFAEVVGRPEEEVASELYMSIDDLISLNEKGFTIGCHTASHRWLNNLSVEEQKIELGKSLDALKRVSPDISKWIMCYPYGGYNEATLAILEKTDCALALTTNVGTADLMNQSKFELPRLNTNDFPQ